MRQAGPKGVTSDRPEQAETRLSEAEFKRRYAENFFDPRFDAVKDELQAVTEVAWQNYKDSRKAPFKVQAGGEFYDPRYELSLQWVQTREKLLAAEKKQKDAYTPSRVLLISGSSRNQHTCPSEIPKSYRLTELARKAFEENQIEVDFLDLSLITAEYGKIIHPCKACISTAMPLCHWPCSCYPNHSLGQSPDWMNEIYERWVAAHGVMIVTPVHWYQAPSGLKLMIDRLVCADGGNPDPTTTHGKNAQEAKQLELAGWPYPKHLAGRAFSVVVHGDSAGVENLRRILTDWLLDMELIQAGHQAVRGEYVGYLEPYATGHEALDENVDFQKSTQNAALSLVEQIKLNRSGHQTEADRHIHEVKPK